MPIPYISFLFSLSLINFSISNSNNNSILYTVIECHLFFLCCTDLTNSFDNSIIFDDDFQRYPIQYLQANIFDQFGWFVCNRQWERRLQIQSYFQFVQGVRDSQLYYRAFLRNMMELSNFCSFRVMQPRRQRSLPSYFILLNI